MHQTLYTQKMIEQPVYCDFNTFRSLRHKIAWPTPTRPEICASVNKVSKVSEEQFSPGHIKFIKATVRRANITKVRGLTQQQLDTDSLQMIFFADSSFPNNEDITTQLGFFVLQADANNLANVLHYSSYKRKRIFCSVLGGETYAFADAFEFELLLSRDLENMMNLVLPLTLLTDSESLFKVVVNASMTTEKNTDD